MEVFRLRSHLPGIGEKGDYLVVDWSDPDYPFTVTRTLPNTCQLRHLIATHIQSLLHLRPVASSPGEVPGGPPGLPSGSPWPPLRLLQDRRSAG
jgi:hypothetical protein